MTLSANVQSQIGDAIIHSLVAQQMTKTMINPWMKIVGMRVRTTLNYDLKSLLALLHVCDMPPQY